jgi:mono/diheme cytochrome c family protein
MFSLSGTMNSLPPPGGGAPAGGPQQSGDAGRPGDPARGAEIYAQACVACHGESGDGGHGGGPTLVDGVDAATIVAIAATGRNTMPAFGAVYSPADLRDVTSYILERLAHQ